MATISNEDYQALLNKLTQLILDENLALRDSMERIESLLKHAIELLNESVFSVNTTIQTHQDSLEQAVVRDEAGSHNPGESLLIALRKALGIMVQLNMLLSKTTRSLQVEDIVSQIVNHVINRTKSIDDVVQDIKTFTYNDKSVSAEEIKHTLNQIALLSQNIHNNPIRQSSLDEGDIELF